MRRQFGLSLLYLGCLIAWAIPYLALASLG